MIFSARLGQMTCDRSLGIGDERRHGPAIREVKTECRISASGKHFGTVQERKCCIPPAVFHSRRLATESISCCGCSLFEWQINALSNTGLLSRFIGMLTDSRSFMSFPRHKYFRRVLCDLLGKDAENGEIPNDEKFLGTMVQNICFHNAQQYLGFELDPASAARSEPVVSA